jgi:hypothetical protein
MSFVKVGSEFIDRKIDQIKSSISVKESTLKIWNANKALHLLGHDVYVNRQQESITSETGVVPDEVRCPCRFVKREEIADLYVEASIQLSIYKMFLEAIDNGDFLMVDDDQNEKGRPGYQLFKKECPIVDALKAI